MYRLLTQCLYKRERKPAHQRILEFRNALLKDDREIEVKDFGAGSRVFKSNLRKVSDIAKNAGISKKRAILLNKLTSYLQINSALELGTSVGISSVAIATGNNLDLLSIEGCPETARVAREYFKKFNLKNIELKVGNFEEVISEEWEVERREWKMESAEKKPESGRTNQTRNKDSKSQKDNPQLSTENRKQKIDLIYFDGNHQKKATLQYFHMLLPLAHNDAVFIFDDIHWSRGMEEAWEEIKKHPQVRVTIDSFFWGMVFFRKEQEKEHFVIRL